MHALTRYALMPVAYVLLAGIRAVELVAISYNRITTPFLQRRKRESYLRRLHRNDERNMQRGYVFQTIPSTLYTSEGSKDFESSLFCDTQECSRLLRKIEDGVI